MGRKRRGEEKFEIGNKGIREQQIKEESKVDDSPVTNLYLRVAMKIQTGGT